MNRPASLAYRLPRLPSVSPRGRHWLTAAVVAVAGLLIGMALAAVGSSRLGLGAMLGLPVGAVAVALVLDRPAAGPALILASLPWGLRPIPAGLVVIQAAVIVAVGSTVLRRLAGGHLPITWVAPLGWGVGVLTLALIATPRALDSTAAVKQDVDIVLGLALVATVATVVTLRQIRGLVHLLLAVGSGICVLSLADVSALRPSSGGEHIANRLHGVFTEPNQFGAFCAVVFVLALGTAIGSRTARERALTSAAAAASLLPLLLALSRGAWIGCLLALAVLAALLPAARRLLLVIGIPALLALPVLGVFAADVPEVQVVQQRVATLRHPQANPYDSRPVIWREAGREIETAPWLGHGPAQFPVVAAESASPAATVLPLHAHNVLLNVAAEIGIPAAALLVGFTLHVAQVLRTTVRRLAPGPDAALVAGVGASLAVVVGQGLVDFTLRNAAIFLLLSTLTGFVLAAHLRGSETEASAPR